MKNKGFTLIEVLTVLIVLAIVSTISVVFVNTYIEESQVGIVKSSAYSYIKQIEYEVENNISHGEDNMFNGNYTDSTLKVVGNNPTLVDVNVINGGVDNGFIVFGEYTVFIEGREVILVTKGSIYLALNGDTPITHEAKTPYVDLGAKAIDAYDGDLTSSIVVTNTVNVNVVGTYTVTYKITNTALEEKEIVRTVNVVDTIKPTIALVGDAAIIHEMNTTYVDQGATATDNYGGDLTSSIVVTHDINPSIRGNYIVTYTVTDSSGNTNSITRDVRVQGLGEPVITILGDNPHEMFPGTYTDLGATAYDAEDGNLTSSITIDFYNVNPAITGSYKVRYRVVDSDLNVTTEERIVNVTDSTPPSVAFVTNGNATCSKTSGSVVNVTDTESGVNPASLKYMWTTTTAEPDEEDFIENGAFSSTFTNGNYIATPTGLTGEYYLWILAKDFAFNDAIIKSNKFVLDNTNPVITISGANPYQIEVGNSFVEPGRSATDNCSTTPTVTNTVIPTAQGTYTITYSATDVAGNTGTATRAFYIWSAYSTTTQGSYNGVRTKLQISTRGSYACYVCNGTCPGTNYYGGSTNYLSMDRLVGTTCQCEYDHVGPPQYWYTGSTYAAGQSTCYDSTWSAWSDTASCTPNASTQCRTLYSYR